MFLELDVVVLAFEDIVDDTGKNEGHKESWKIEDRERSIMRSLA